MKNALLWLAIALILVVALWCAVHLQRATATAAALEHRIETLEEQPVPVLRIEAQEIGQVACPWGTEPFTSTEGIQNGFWVYCNWKGVWSECNQEISSANSSLVPRLPWLKDGERMG